MKYRSSLSKSLDAHARHIQKHGPGALAPTAPESSDPSRCRWCGQSKNIAGICMGSCATDPIYVGHCEE